MSGNKVKVMSIFGTRPEAIKTAPVIQLLEKDGRFNHCAVVTAQHRDMLDQALKAFDIIPSYDLNIMEHGQSPADVIARSLQGLAPILQDENPDMVLVHGDTVTTLAGGMAAFFQKIPVGHVEAGLRTGNRYAPYPEEMNRKLVGSLANVHFAPTPQAKLNLLGEGVDEKDVYVVGNTVIDALLSQIDANYRFLEPDLQHINFAARRILLVTTHRRENMGRPLRDVYTTLHRIVDELDDIEIVLPLHKNPVVRELAREVLGTHPKVHLVEPPGYRSFVNLMARATLIITDSGGIQEEAPALGRPVLLLRETTERPEGVAAGTCVLVGTDPTVIHETALDLLTDSKTYERMAQATNPYGDGKAAQRIVAALAYTFGLERKRPQEFIIGSTR